MASDPSKRIPWYRIHIVTCLAVMIVGAAMLWCQASATELSSYHISIGWPIQYEAWHAGRVLPLHTNVAYVINTITAIILMFGTGFVVEQVIRRTASRLQFSLTAAVVVITAVAVMLGERYAEFNMYVLAERLELHPTLLSDRPWYLYVPIYFAIFCTLCSLAWGVVALISQWCRRFDR